MRRNFIIFALAALLTLLHPPHSSRADTVVLKNGARIEGDVKRTEAGWTVSSPDGKSTDVAADDVRTIEVGSSTKPNTTAAATNLASLERATDAIKDPALAIERYRRFIDEYKSTPSAVDARRDIAIWQDRLDRGLVKVGTQWVTPAQQTEMASQASTVSKQAADLLKQGRTREAEPVIQQALDADPQNPAALYLRGLMLYGEDQIVAARKAFESVIAVVTDSAPTYNNLAVILWKQNQQMAAIKYYEQGITASPVNKVMLDNVAEALAALPRDQQRNPLAVRVSKRFSEQDSQLQTVMAQSGFHRWGATWVDQPTLDKLKAKEQEIRDELKKLADESNALSAKIVDIDSSIEANTRSMNQMQADSVTRDAKGNLYQGALPGNYYTMQSDNDHLTAERAQFQAKMQDLGRQAQKVEQSLPVPRYTGIQKLIGIEGAPFPPTTAPSTAPATSPGASPTSLPVMMPLP